MPYFGSLPDTLFIGATDLQAIAGIVVEDLSGLFAPGRRRGDDIAVPYVSGATGVPDLPFEAYSFEIPVTILCDEADGDDPAGDHLRRAQMIANLRAISTALDVATGTGLFTMTRRLAKSPSGYDEHTAQGRFVDGLAPTAVNFHTGRAVLQFVNLTGCWLDGSSNPVVP